MTDTFFDLQRFAAPVLVGGESSFTWQDGEFAAGESTAIGTQSNPAYWVAKSGLSTAVAGSEVWLKNSFSIGKDWSIKLGSDGVAQVTNEDGLALTTLEDTVAALELNGIFEESFNGNDAYIKTAADTKVTLNSEISLLSEKFGKDASDIDVVVGGGIVAEFTKGAENVNIGVAKDNLAKGFSFDKAAEVGGNVDNGEITIYTDKANEITLPDGDVWKVKKTSAFESAEAEIYYNIANAAVDSVIGIKGATLEGDVTAPVLVGTYVADSTVWNEISGDINSIAFDSVGAAKVDNTGGAVTVDGQESAQVTIQTLDEATVNGIKVAATKQLENVAFTLETVEGGGLSAVTLKTPGELTVNKDKAFDVNVGKTSYDVATTADTITFNASASKIEVDVVAEKSYNVDGGAASFNFNGAKKATVNGVEVSVGDGEEVVANTSADAEGITNVTGVQADDKVSVSGDGDGFSVVFNAVEDNGEHVFEVNDASIRAANIEGQIVNISLEGSDVYVTGMTSTENVSVEGATGLTYHFKDATKDNQVATSAGEAMYVTLDNTGAVSDYMDDANYKKLKENDQGKWDNVASIGNQDNNAQPVDTVPANKSDVFNRFYNLGTSDAGQVSVATFTNEDSTDAPSTVANPTGVTFTGRDGNNLAEEAHVSLSTGSSVGAAPINIQTNENAVVVDVVIDQRNATVPSTIAIGTLADTLDALFDIDLDASHEIYLSNVGVGYAEIGEYATGQNKIFAGTGGAQIRHDGVRATITGNTGNDTIWAARNDIVTGGAGADAFYDSANYTITDYSAAQGDALIATRLHSVDEVTKANLNFDADEGNKIGFGTSNKMFTINKDQNAALLLNVDIMDTDARVVGSRNVAVAGINGGALDASSFTGAALIVADKDRNGNSGDVVIGTAANDTIYVGANDIVNGSAGNDFITIGGISAGDGGALIAVGEGKNTVAGWTFGFDSNKGATELVAAEGFYGSFENDRLLVTDANGSMLFDDTKQTSQHGEYQVLINGDKWMAIRTNDVNNTNPDSYGDVASNDELADVYIAERAGILSFGEGVTEDLGDIVLDGYKYRDITTLTLNNNSKAVVMGSSERETVALGGAAAAGANKVVALGTGNDVIISGGDSSLTAGHELLFGVGDGRDTIRNFGHYLGVDADPDKQYADTIVLGQYGGIYTGTGEDGGTRIEFITGDESRVFLYEDAGISTENTYQIKVGDFATKLAKIGNSDSANNFTYSDKVAYYVGNSANNAADTLTVGNGIANANIWLDGTHGTNYTADDEEYYRGIAFVDAGAETNTTIQLAGNGSNNTLIGGGEGTYNSLWGGAGNNVLIGSSAGQDTFFYVRNAGAYLQGVDDTVTGGNDTVQNYNLDNGDIVWLGDTTIDDIASTDVKDNSVTVNFKNGGSLTVEGSDDVRFLLNQGTESWVTDKDSASDNKWTKE